MNSYDIVYSVVAHESPECVWNLYENIIKFHKNKNVLVIFNFNSELGEYFENEKLPKNFKINYILKNKKKYTSDIFIAHLYNYWTISEYKFEFFCTLASNCLFVKSPNWPEIITETPRLKPGSGKGVFYLPDTTKAFWDEFMLCGLIVDVFRKEGIEPRLKNHEGTYYRKDVINWIWWFCFFNKINHKEAFANDTIAFEEVMFPSLEYYCTGQVSRRYCGINPELTQNELVRIIDSGGCQSIPGNHYNIVKVPRDVNNELRKIVNGI